MDAQVDKAESPFLQWATGQAEWSDLAVGSAEEDAPTYGRDPQWDRYSEGAHITKIDYVFANRLGRSLVRNFGILRDLPCPGHLGLEVTLDFSAFSSKVARWIRPKSYPLGEVKVHEDEVKALGERYANENKQAFEEANNMGDIGKMYQAASNAGEDFMEHICTDFQVKGTRGRGKPPKFTAGWAIPAALPFAGALSRAQWRYHKLQLQLAELVKKVGNFENGGQVNYEGYWNIVYLWRAVCKRMRQLRPTCANWPGWWDPSIIPMAVDIERARAYMESEAKCYAVEVAKRRAKKWTDQMRSSYSASRKDLRRWIKNEEADPATYLKDPEDGSIVVDVAKIHALMEKVWLPIFARYAQDEVRPTWQRFRDEYWRELPPGIEVNTPEITDDIQRTFLQKRPRHKAMSLDGWSTFEAKRQPNQINAMFAETMREAQRTGELPEAVRHVPNPTLKKGDGELPKDQRLLAVLSVWYYAWEVPMYRLLNEWRAGWTHPTSFGATAGATIQDVSTSLAILIERSRHLEIPLGGVALDRQKCFDYLVTDICIGLQRQAGCPEEVVRLRTSFYERHYRYLQVAGSFGKPLHLTNGHLQGSAFSLDDVKLLMYVWTARKYRVVPRGISVTFVDDSNSAMEKATEVVLSLGETAKFDALSGQIIHPGKIVGWATDERLWREISEIEIYNIKIPMQPSFRLVGAIMVSFGGEDSEKADTKLSGAIKRLKRVARIPGNAIHRSEVAVMMVASVIHTGLETNSPSEKKIGEYNNELFKACVHDGRKWCCAPVLLAIAVKGHALGPKCLVQRAALLAVRRQVLRLPGHRSHVATLRDWVQDAAGPIPGPVKQLVKALEMLGWSWPEVGVLRTDMGTDIQWLDWPISWAMHELRASQRRYLLRRVPITRNDLGSIRGHEHLVDFYATTWLLRTKAKKWKLDVRQQAFLITYLIGGDHTQQRPSRSKIAIDESPLRRYCDEEEETQAHTVLRCRCWESCRATPRRLGGQPSTWPPYTQHCGIVSGDGQLEALRARLFADPPLECPRPPQAGEDDLERAHRYQDDEGRWWTWVATDGACSDPTHPLLTRAGYGAFVAEGHRCNVSARLPGPAQSAARAEIAALVHLVASVDFDAHILIDNLAVQQTFEGLCSGQPVPQAHRNLWERAQRALEANTSASHPTTSTAILGRRASTWGPSGSLRSTSIVALTRWLHRGLLCMRFRGRFVWPLWGGGSWQLLCSSPPFSSIYSGLARNLWSIVQGASPRPSSIVCCRCLKLEGFPLPLRDLMTRSWLKNLSWTPSRARRKTLSGLASVWTESGYSQARAARLIDRCHVCVALLFGLPFGL